MRARRSWFAPTTDSLGLNSIVRPAPFRCRISSLRRTRFPKTGTLSFTVPDPAKQPQPVWLKSIWKKGSSMPRRFWAEKTLGSKQDRSSPPKREGREQPATEETEKNEHQPLY